MLFHAANAYTYNRGKRYAFRVHFRGPSGARKQHFTHPTGKGAPSDHDRHEVRAARLVRHQKYPKYAFGGMSFGQNLLTSISGPSTSRERNKSSATPSTEASTSSTPRTATPSALPKNTLAKRCAISTSRDTKLCSPAKCTSTMGIFQSHQPRDRRHAQAFGHRLSRPLHHPPFRLHHPAEEPWKPGRASQSRQSTRIGRQRNVMRISSTTCRPWPTPMGGPDSPACSATTICSTAKTNASSSPYASSTTLL